MKMHVKMFSWSALHQESPQIEATGDMRTLDVGLSPQSKTVILCRLHNSWLLNHISRTQAELDTPSAGSDALASIK